jgi:ABC-type glutathione transport system ATPase component
MCLFLALATDCFRLNTYQKTPHSSLFAKKKASKFVSDDMLAALELEGAISAAPAPVSVPVTKLSTNPVKSSKEEKDGGYSTSDDSKASPDKTVDEEMKGDVPAMSSSASSGSKKKKKKAKFSFDDFSFDDVPTKAEEQPVEDAPLNEAFLMKELGLVEEQQIAGEDTDDEEPAKPVFTDGLTAEQRIRREKPKSRIRFAESAQPNFVSMSLDHVSLIYGNDVIIKDSTLSVSTGQRVGLVGPNGGGKTTQLKILYGDLEPTTGDVVKSSKDLRVAMLRQEFIDELDMTRTLREVTSFF